MYSDCGSVELTKLLLVEPDAAAARQYVQQLNRCGVALESIATLPDADEAYAHTAWRLALLSCDDSGSACRSAVRRFKNRFPDTPVIMISEQGSLTQAIEVMRDGADDFLIKPVSDAQLSTALQRAIPKPETAGPSNETGAVRLIGSSPAMHELNETSRTRRPIEGDRFPQG